MLIVENHVGIFICRYLIYFQVPTDEQPVHRPVKQLYSRCLIMFQPRYCNCYIHRFIFAAGMISFLWLVGYVMVSIDTLDKVLF